MALTVRLSPEWRSDDITIPEGGSFLAFVKDSPHPVVVFKVEEFDGGFAVANFKPGKGSTDHDRRGIVYRIECQGARIELPKSLTYQQAMHHAGLFLRELRSAA